MYKGRSNIYSDTVAPLKIELKNGINSNVLKSQIDEKDRNEMMDVTWKSKMSDFENFQERRLKFTHEQIELNYNGYTVQPNLNESKVCILGKNEEEVKGYVCDIMKNHWLNTERDLNKKIVNNKVFNGKLIHSPRKKVTFMDDDNNYGNKNGNIEKDNSIEDITKTNLIEDHFNMKENIDLNLDVTYTICNNLISEENNYDKIKKGFKYQNLNIIENLAIVPTKQKEIEEYVNDDSNFFKDERKEMNIMLFNNERKMIISSKPIEEKYILTMTGDSDEKKNEKTKEQQNKLTPLKSQIQVVAPLQNVTLLLDIKELKNSKNKIENAKLNIDTDTNTDKDTEVLIVQPIASEGNEMNNYRNVSLNDNKRKVDLFTTSNLKPQQALLLNNEKEIKDKINNQKSFINNSALDDCNNENKIVQESVKKSNILSKNYVRTRQNEIDTIYVSQKENLKHLEYQDEHIISTKKVKFSREDFIEVIKIEDADENILLNKYNSYIPKKEKSNFYIKERDIIVEQPKCKEDGMNYSRKINSQTIESLNKNEEKHNKINEKHTLDKTSKLNTSKFIEKLNIKNEEVNNSYNLINQNNSNKSNKTDDNKKDPNFDTREKCHEVHNNGKIDKNQVIFEIDDDPDLSYKVSLKIEETKVNEGIKVKSDEKLLNQKEVKIKSTCCGGTRVTDEIAKCNETLEISINENLTNSESKSGSLENQGYLDLSEQFLIEDLIFKKVDDDKLEDQKPKTYKKKKIEKPKYNYFEDVISKADVIDNTTLRTSLIIDASIDSATDISFKQDLTDNDFPIKKDDIDNAKFWPTYVYRIKQENYSNLILACILKAKVGGIGKQRNIECLEISTDKFLPHIDLSEDVASTGFELRPSSADLKFNFNTPWKIFIPHVLLKNSPKELVILSLKEDNESWNELITSEVNSDEIKEYKMRFVEAKLESPYGTFLVQTKTKVDTGIINKHGARVTSSIDGRVFLSVPADALRITLNTTLKINSIDNNFWKELKSKSEKSTLDQVICSSHLIDFNTKKKKLIKPAIISCFLPLNPEIKKLNEAQSKIILPTRKTFSSDDEENSVDKFTKIEMKTEFNPFQKSLLMKGITGANANESIQVVCNSQEEDKWYPLENVQLTTDKSKEQISMELSILQSMRYFMVRAHRNITVENLAKSMRMIENEFSVRNSVITLMKSTNDSNAFVLTICLRSRSDRCISQHIEDGYQIESQNAPIHVELTERQIVTVKFIGNVTNQKSYRNVLKFTHQSLFQINYKFRVVEMNSYAQRAIDHYRGYLQIYTRKLVKRPIEVIDQKNKKGNIQYHFVVEDVLICQLLLSIPKKKLVHYKSFKDTIFNKNILESYITLFETIAEGIRVSWNDLGKALHIPESRMQSIRHHNNPHHFERMLVQMLIFWFKGLEMMENKPEILMKVLYEMNRIDLVTQIKKIIEDEHISFSDSIV